MGEETVRSTGTWVYVTPGHVGSERAALAINQFLDTQAQNRVTVGRGFQETAVASVDAATAYEAVDEGNSLGLDRVWAEAEGGDRAS
ncbi:MAG: hypothetical protein ACRCYR_12975 [Phycicoccus sp.]